MYPFRFLGHTTQRLRPGRGFLSACRSVRPSGVPSNRKDPCCVCARKDRKDSVAFMALKPITLGALHVPIVPISVQDPVAASMLYIEMLFELEFVP
jgi:hypothetical protein